MARLFCAIVIAAILSTGCATSASKLNSVNVGMTKQDVISVLGSPASISAKEGVEYLHYVFQIPGTVGLRNVSNYFVRLTNGKVDSYGHLGDFNSTNVPET